MTTHPQSQTTAPRASVAQTPEGVNLQTPGPLEWQPIEGDDSCSRKGFALWSYDLGVLVAERRPETPDNPRELMEANARTLSAGFNLLDKTGRALDLDAATLGESIDLVGLIRAARDVLDHVDNGIPFDGSPLDRDRQSVQHLRAALSTLPALP